ncbi:BTB/POZ domain-containing protein 2-like [Chrysoperla carnea]|uniref:BTB/POZ domain-containing protein 2-like n=1 Tax=Chrysoperla carnea TaxID=189513 RepID=UPI001D08090A|nr:BTB/POZ domain-containing protein 2-like [Chrysoperla carnea]
MDSIRSDTNVIEMVLSVACNLFQAMLYGSLTTKYHQVELPDIKFLEFLEFLKFICSDGYIITYETVMFLLYVGKKYNVIVLADFCVDFLKNNIHVNNVILLLRQARFFDEQELEGKCVNFLKFNLDAYNSIYLLRQARIYNEQELENKCLNIIDRHAMIALSANGFIDTDLNTLTTLLERNTIEIEELQLYKAILRWAEAECVRQQLPLSPENRRFVLGHAFNLIRFPLMTIEEFSGGPVQSGLLTDREVKELFLYFTVHPKPRVKFSNIPRFLEKSYRIEQKVKIFKNCFYSETELFDNSYSSINFIVDRPVIIVGFGLFGPIHSHGSVVLDVNLELKHKDTDTIVGSTEISFSSDGSLQMYQVNFDESILITSHTYYTATVYINARTEIALSQWWGVEGQSKVACKVFDKHVNFQFSSSGIIGLSTVNSGQLAFITFAT